VAPDLELRSAERSLLLFVSVADRLHPFGVDGGRLDAGTLDLQQLARGAVARSPASTSSHKSAYSRDLTVFRHSRKMGLSANPVDKQIRRRAQLAHGLVPLSGELP
jgi:hypothetical protein